MRAHLALAPPTSQPCPAHHYHDHLRGGFACFCVFVVSPATHIDGRLRGVHAAGVAVGPAALFVLRGLVCLQCNVKLPKLVPCGTCKLKFCKSCQDTHCCIGRLPLPRGVAEASTSAGGGGRGSSVSKGVFFGSGSMSEGAGAGGGRFTPQAHTRWELGGAIGDDWEALFIEVREKRETGRGGKGGQIEAEDGGGGAELLCREGGGG